jgi:opacity protein-like surface antigen
MNREVMKKRVRSGQVSWGWIALVLAMSSSSAKAELILEPASQAPVTSTDSPAEAPVMEAVPAAPVPTVATAAVTAAPVQVIQAQPAPVAVPAQPYPVFITAPAPAPVAAPAAAPAASEQATSRTELVRRERMREELRNEDLLQERLEDLRLQDEKRRTGQVLGQSMEAPASPAPLGGMAATTVAPSAAPVIQEQVVSVPVSDQGASSAGVSTIRAADLQSAMGDEEVFTIRLAPRGGLSNFAGSSPYNIKGRYTMGVGLDLGVSDHLGFEINYSYSDYGLALNDSTALALSGLLNPYGFAYGGADNYTGALKQNVVDAGLKLHLLGMASRIRPFIGGGAGYSKSFLNYDPRILNFLRQYNYAVPADYEVSQFLAYATAGLEIRISKSVNVGASYRHYTVLSARQNQDLYNPALYGAYPGAMYYGGGMGGMSSVGQQYVGGSLSNTSFNTMTATVSFLF